MQFTIVFPLNLSIYTCSFLSVYMLWGWLSIMSFAFNFVRLLSYLSAYLSLDMTSTKQLDSCLMFNWNTGDRLRVIKYKYDILAAHLYCF